MNTKSPKSCKECGYDLRGLQKGTPCPECGQSKKSRQQLVSRQSRLSEPKLCRTCGYERRGLPIQAVCPECGSAYIPEKTGKSNSGESKLMSIIDSNLAILGLKPMPDIRLRCRISMRLGGIFVLCVLGLQLLVTFAFIPIGLYRSVLFCLSMAWPLVVVGMMPSNVEASMPPMYAYIRKFVIPSQLCWAIGYAMWIMFHVSLEKYTLGGNLIYFKPILLLHAVAGLGLAGLAFWLHDLALRLDLHVTAWRCNVVSFAICTLGVLVFILPWKHFAAAGLTAEQGGLMWWALILALMGPWLYIVLLFARALFEFGSFAGWSMKHDHDIEGRIDRVREKRESYVQEQQDYNP